jgi:hypothetical protein
VPIHLFPPLAEEAGLAALAMQMNSERAYECFPPNASNAPRCEPINAAVGLVQLQDDRMICSEPWRVILTSADRETGLAPITFFFSLAAPRLALSRTLDWGMYPPLPDGREGHPAH